LWKEKGTQGKKKTTPSIQNYKTPKQQKIKNKLSRELSEKQKTSFQESFQKNKKQAFKRAFKLNTVREL
jgi:hypothetical protein